ncbi:protein let-653-like [Haliotis rufescens]|uniref:protein let-653-like n=1 Tax=Haliotis rufescens TaxID=6454 RepID=UPI00201F8189|nr:protein let-653-like [Haliotis rufescens]
MSCHDVTTLTECLKECSSEKLCNSVFVYKPSMVCCLNKMRVYTSSDSQAAPGHVHYVSAWVAKKKTMMSSATAASEITTETAAETTITTTEEETSTQEVVTTETTATTSTPTTTITTETTTMSATTASTTTAEATAVVLSTGFTYVPSLHLTFKASSPVTNGKDAQRLCAGQNGHLIYLKTAARRTFITEYLSNTGISEFYIGAYMVDALTATWSDGTPVVNPPWAPSEPHQDAKCISMIIPSGEWKDVACTQIMHYICEI